MTLSESGRIYIDIEKVLDTYMIRYNYNEQLKLTVDSPEPWEDILIAWEVKVDERKVVLEEIKVLANNEAEVLGIEEDKDLVKDLGETFRIWRLAESI